MNNDAENILAGLDGRQDFRYFPFPSVPEDLKISGWRPTGEITQADAVIVTEDIRAQQSKFDNYLPNHLIPVVSVCGVGAYWYDAVLDYRTENRAMLATFSLIDEIVSRIAQLHSNIRHSNIAEDLLLARLFTRERTLAAEYFPQDKQVIRYPLAGRLHEPLVLANKLTEQAQLTRNFFDKLHVCTNCQGMRFNIREECVTCRSADIVEEPIIHHFKCSHQARQSAFRTVEKFQCPKCGEALRHIGLDYDKPGILIVCNSCQHMTDACAVGFRCMDCDGKFDSQTVPTRTWYNYELSARGVQTVLHGAPTSERYLIPESFRALIRHSLREDDTFKTPFTVLRLHFARKNYPDALLWHRLKNLLADCIHSGLRPVDVMCEAGDEFYLLLPRANTREANKRVLDIQQRMTEVLQHDPQMRADVLDRAAILQLINQE